MNLHHLRTLVAISECRTFTEAGQVLGLSHSAVSVHIKELERSLGSPLLDRSRRPPVLNYRGRQIVERARQMFELSGEIQSIGSEAGLSGALNIGVVSTELPDLLAPSLSHLHETQPGIVSRVKVGLSGDLAMQVLVGELDLAITTAPTERIENLEVTPIGDEQLFVVAPQQAEGQDFRALLTSYPFIWFNRKSWAGQAIEGLILREGIRVEQKMEIDSLESIESLVRAGLGVSVVPRRLGVHNFAQGLYAVPFGTRTHVRQVVFVERKRSETGPPAQMFKESVMRIAAKEVSPPEGPT